MNTQKMLSGYELVAKGATKTEITLPEVGLKDVFPNRSWLENKQTQAAIEARKQLIEVEKINKSGILSHAEWRKDLMLAEVTQKVGSYWQYLGHNVGKKLFLEPEEALFLLEINSLCLKHNNVIVSLQQAYSLLLKDRITLLQYKVYASLSRLGYRVYRHHISEFNTLKEKVNTEKGMNNANIETTHHSCTNVSEKSSEIILQCEIEIQGDNNTAKHGTANEHNKEELQEIQTTDAMEVVDLEEKSKQTNKQSSSNDFPSCQMNRRNICNLKKLQKLKDRQLMPCNSEVLCKYFDKIPELLGKQTVTLKTPDKQLLPQNINLNKTTYRVNLQNIQNKIIRPSSTETNIYSVNEEVNGSHIRRLRNTNIRPESNWIPPTGNVRFIHNQNTYFRPFHNWRPSRPFYFYNINMDPIYRANTPNWFFTPNFHYYQRPQPGFWRLNFNNRFINNFNRKIMRKTAQKHHLDGILKLAAQLKELILNGNTQEQNIYSLQRLIQTYNTRYKTKLRLNERFDIVIDETIVDTIELDDDDEGPSSKRPRTTDGLFEENLNNLKVFALRLKDLECNDKSSGRHRRAFSKLLKTFNESYNEDYYLNDGYEVVNRNHIDLDTSDSDDLDCIIEPNDTNACGKKLKNPFNIIKRLSEKNVSDNLDSSSENGSVAVTNKNYNQTILRIFTKDWLPGDDDFGRAEVITKDVDFHEQSDMKKDEFLYDFIKIQRHRYDNWFELKNSFYNSVQAAIAEFQNTIPSRERIEINSIVKPEDCADMESVLKKLSIIKTNKETTVCNFEIDFDVYNRDVQNFRKTNRPTPHFRLICIDGSTDIPSGGEIAALHAKSEDKVAILFAIVSVDSISYIQINPTELPMYISS